MKSFLNSRAERVKRARAAPWRWRPQAALQQALAARALTYGPRVTVRLLCVTISRCTCHLGTSFASALDKPARCRRTTFTSCFVAETARASRQSSELGGHGHPSLENYDASASTATVERSREGDIQTRPHILCDGGRCRACHALCS